MRTKAADDVEVMRTVLLLLRRLMNGEELWAIAVIGAASLLDQMRAA